MLHALAQNWWLVLIRGIAAILFAILAFMWPGLTLLALVILYGAYAFVDGISSLVLAFSRRADKPWWEMLLVGFAGLGAGLITFFWPGLTAFALVLIIAVWAIVRGFFEILAAIQLRKHITNEWLLVISGLLSIAFGLLLIFQPGAGALTLVWLIATFALMIGIVEVFLSFRLYRLKHELPESGVNPRMA